MKVILEFNLPDDNIDHHLAINASNLFNVLIELDDFLRTKIKYEDHILSQEKFDTYEEVRQKLRDIMSENFINFDQFR